ncbi:hypothetical protein CVD28_23360 [Bacillus sp. M6-12]|uniref:ABC transporter substrate-binding protein n=1 Tax=Bacillus sp. M6-12 TaxID=2054166 RepID=UPI000C779120|nr:ABC transporter substrate-binding protein [Bacillus sp. M6-12]PLS15269.1 hypothetical protein CVD28_23360 [Bacillus sp. M6-12]
MVQTVGAAEILNPAKIFKSRSYNCVEGSKTTRHKDSINVHKSNFLKLAGDGAEGNLLAAQKILVAESLSEDDPQRKFVQEFVAEFNKKYDSDPDAFAGYAVDGINILAKALEKTDGSAENLSKAVEEVKYAGVTGALIFQKNTKMVL